MKRGMAALSLLLMAVLLSGCNMLELLNAAYKTSSERAKLETPLKNEITVEEYEADVDDVMMDGFITAPSMSARASDGSAKRMGRQEICCVWNARSLPPESPTDRGKTGSACQCAGPIFIL